MGYSNLMMSWMLFVVVVSSSAAGEGIKSTRFLDLVIRDYTFKSILNNIKHLKTGTPYSISLPSNLSGITVYTSRYRCGSLKRYGATISEFHLNLGVHVHPCIQRILIVTQNLGNNWSKIYYDNYEDALVGYQLVSPVLGLLAYNYDDEDTQFEVKIEGGININFRRSTISDLDGRIKMCATFEGDGRVRLAKEVTPYVCGAASQGHFGLVVQSPLLPVRKKMMRRWTLAFGCSLAAAIALFLLGLLLIAMFLKVKKKARLEEMERRAYEEEAFQVSMVGHLHTASATR